VLKGKKILLGVSGSIAAYKAAFLVRLLIKSGAEVKVVMTPSAPDFISPLTLATLSRNPVYHTFSIGNQGEWVNHVELGLWADLMVVAPATANTLGKFAQGICDNLLCAVYLSARCPVWLAPAMDLDMYRHPSTQSNLQKLISYGNKIINPAHGELASGLIGEGRLAEPEEIFEQISSYFEENKTQRFKGKKVLITAGPTYEALDPVRYLGNHSTGKMGYAIAEALAVEGAEVVLVSGPSSLTVQHPAIKVVKVVSADEMYKEASAAFDHSEISIFSAAVADYKPAQREEQKIKKNDELFSVDFVKNVDIARTLGARKKAGQIIVGFALETENEKANAIEKLQRKNFDLIVLNSLNDKGAGFAGDTNKITLLDRNNNSREFGLKNKKEVALDIIEAILPLIHA